MEKLPRQAPPPHEVVLCLDRSMSGHHRRPRRPGLRAL